MVGLDGYGWKEWLGRDGRKDGRKGGRKEGKGRKEGRKEGREAKVKA
jgi:hypothetical protein